MIKEDILIKNTTRELDEINREFNAHYEVDDKRGGNRGGCSMM